MAALALLLAAPVSAASLWEALQQLAERHQVRLAARSGEALQQQPAAAVALPATLEKALDLLLQDSAFRWRRLPTGMIVVEPRAAVRLALDPLQITGHAVTPVAGAIHDGDAPAPPSLRPEDVLGAEALRVEQLAMTPLQRSDVLWRRAPNVVAVGDGLAIRGVERGSVATATSQTYLDGIPLPSSVLRALPVGASLAAVDYQRGPRTLADSLGGLGGAVRLQGTVPVPRREQSALLQAGTDSRLLGVALQAGALPFGSSARLALQQREETARLRGPDGQRAIDTALRGMDGRWRWEPDALPGLTLDLAGFLQRGELAPDRVTPSRGAAADPRQTQSSSALPIARGLDAEGLAIALASAAPWRGELGLTLGVADSDLATLRRFGSATAEQERLDERERLQSVELGWHDRLAGDIDLGLSLNWGERRSDRQEVLLSPLAGFFPPGVLLGVDGSSRRRFASRSDELARTASAQLRIGRMQKAWWWSAALQRQREQRSQRQSRDIGLDGGDCTLRFIDGPVPCADEFPTFATRLGVTADAWQSVPQLALGVQPLPDWEFGLLLRRGLLPGGARLNPADQSTVRYAAERSDTAELSARWQGDALQASLTLFHNRWRDRQVRLDLPVAESFLIVNAGEAQARGGEASVSGGWDDDRGRWYWRAAVGFLDSEFLRIDAGSALLDDGAVGRAFPSAPRWTAALGLDWEHGPWRAQLAGWGSAAAFSDATNSAAGRRPGHAVFDAVLHYRYSPRLSLHLLVENLADRPYLEDVRVAGAVPQVRDYLPGRRREVALGLRYDWP